MILVTLGTQDKSFKRLLKAIDKEIESKKIKEKVIVQAGFTKYKSNNMEIFDLIPEEEFEKLVKECRVLITHGGVGSILAGIKNNKPVIAAARLEKYKEHTNNHQQQIIREFVDMGYIVELNDFDELGDILSKIEKFKIRKFTSNTLKFVKNVEQYIDEDNHVSWFNKYRSFVANGYRGMFLSIINMTLAINLNHKMNVYFNTLVAFIITLLLSLFLNMIMDIKISKLKYFIIYVFSFLLELIMMYMCVSIFNISFNVAKVSSLIMVLIVNYVLIKKRV